MPNQRNLNFTVKEQKELGINNTAQFLQSCQSILEKATVRCNRDKSLSNIDKLNELDEINTFLEVIQHFQKP